MKSNLLALALASALATPSFADGGPWVPDFDEAVAIAKREGKDLLVDFTGSDWCKWCKVLDQEVFSQEQFLTAATKDYVLVALDFPNGEEARSRVPNPERNRELSEKYGIDSFPTVLLMSAEGEVFGRTGYQPGGAAPYLERLGELREAGKQALELTRSYRGAKDPAAKRAAVERALAFLDAAEDASDVVGLLVEPLRGALELDPRNESGLKLRALKALLASENPGDQAVAAAREMDPKNETGLLELAVMAVFRGVRDEAQLRPACEAALALIETGKVHDQETMTSLMVTGAMWSERHLKDAAMARRFAARALDLGIENEELAAELKRIAGA